MARFEELRAVDIIGPAMERMNEHGYSLRKDGKIRPEGNWGYNVGGPWINNKVDLKRNCNKWTLYSEVYGIISRNCFNCWKIVVKPRNLTELFQLYDLEREYVLDEEALACKCGIERRPWRAHTGWYAGFFYCPLGCGQAEARKWYEKIEKLIHEKMNKDITIVLKRACTEMEDRAGPSHLWEYPERQGKFEELLDSVWVVPKGPRGVEASEPQVLRVTIILRWIDWGVKHADPEAQKYIDSMVSFGVSPTTLYHEKHISLRSDPDVGPAVEEDEVEVYDPNKQS